MKIIDEIIHACSGALQASDGRNCYLVWHRADGLMIDLYTRRKGEITRLEI